MPQLLPLRPEVRDVEGVGFDPYRLALHDLDAVASEALDLGRIIREHGGMAHPEVEPYGSFSEDYRRAEAGMAGSIGRTMAMRVVLLEEEQVAYAKWKRNPVGEPPPNPDITELQWLERIREQRWPDEYGSSKHRKVEPEHDGDRWLEDHALQSEQLEALVSDPPEPIKRALIARFDDIYAMAIAAGWKPKGVKRE